MKRKRIWSVAGGFLLAAFVVAILLFFSASLNNLESGHAAEGRRQLEESLRRAAVACYAAEGSYPMDVAYLEEHYGIQIDTDRYTVRYDAFAQNLMPDITVLENGT
jgi:hypothetical protein